MNHNSENLKKDLLGLFSDGKDKLHILADFDGTLAKDFIDGEKVPSIISVLRDHPGYLSPYYQEAAKELYRTYAPFENDTQLSLEVRKAKMNEWWGKHDKLLIESGLTRAHIEQVATSGIIQLKDGAREFLEHTHRLDIPVVIISASGLGEAIPLYCRYEKVDFPNVYFLINRFTWDSAGRATGCSVPIIHSLNKDETLLSDFPDVYSKINKRMNVLLLGNSSGDVGMIQGFDYKKLLTIGFVDREDLDKKSKLEKDFKYVIFEGYQELNEVFSTCS